MARPDLAIIVTSYQMPWHVRRVLESIAAQRTEKRLEVIVADDGSTDETPQVVAEFAATATFPVQFWTHPHTTFHAARCRNAGVRGSTAPQLLFVDGDCLLPPGHIDQHLRLAKPGVVTCSYCIRLDEATSERVTLGAVRSGSFCEWVSLEDRRKLRQMHFKAVWYTVIGHPTKPAFRSGNFSITRQDYERINGFDENFRGWGCEDDDFGRRLRASGIQAVSILNRTCVYHLWHPPAQSRPSQWKQGGNVAYLQRPVRLARCIQGLEQRRPEDLTCRVMVEGPVPKQLDELLARHGWFIEPSRRLRTDLEVLCHPGRGRFSPRTDCRVLLVVNEQAPLTASAAHIVLSASGQAGAGTQIRLAMDDTEGFMRALAGSDRTSCERWAA